MSISLYHFLFGMFLLHFMDVILGTSSSIFRTLVFGFVGNLCFLKTSSSNVFCFERYIFLRPSGLERPVLSPFNFFKPHR